MAKLCAVVLVLCTVFVAGAAEGRRDDTFAYPYSHVWEASVRLIRVDYASPIRERNREDGYFLFAYTHDGKEHSGSVEVVRMKDREVRVVIQIPTMPSYVEQMMLDKLDRKLLNDYGAPAEKKPEKKPAEEKPSDGEKKPDAPEKGGDAEK